MMKRTGDHAGLARPFDLSFAGYFLDFALVPIAASSLLCWSRHVGLAFRDIGLAALTGVIVWTLAEYWIHRLVFHGATAFEPMHQMHHRLPKDMIGVASYATFVGFSGIWLIGETFAGAAMGSAFAAGFMLGYLIYCAVHVRMHHGRRERFGRYVGFMFDHHAGHHRGAKGNYGVSSPVWDLVFGTFSPKDCPCAR